MLKRFRIFILGLLASGVALAGCSGGHQARSVDLRPDAILVNPDIYVKGGDGQMLHRYADKTVDINRYKNVIIDPVLIYKQDELDKGRLENYQKLANNAFVYLNEEFSKQLKVVKEPEPGTMRIQMAIIDVKRSAPVRMVLSSATPIGLGLGAVKFAATGKQTGVGEVTAEIRATDAMTGQLLAAGYDRRVGNKQLEGLYDTWSDADRALQYWAKKGSYFICHLKGGKDCVPPGNL